MASRSRGSTGGIADENGETVEQFAMTMRNLGLARAGEVLVEMLKSDRWRDWSQGGRRFQFLPGEFDYFLTQQDIQRPLVLAIPDLDAKSQLEKAMDERRTGEEGYRRPISVARKELPELPGRPAMPFGFTRREADELFDTDNPRHRPALGDAVRRYSNSGGLVQKKQDTRSRFERLAASTKRLSDEELNKLKEIIADEIRHRNS